MFGTDTMDKARLERRGWDCPLRCSGALEAGSSWFSGAMIEVFYFIRKMKVRKIVVC
jgi:hypothetical protein